MAKGQGKQSNDMKLVRTEIRIDQKEDGEKDGWADKRLIDGHKDELTDKEVVFRPNGKLETFRIKYHQLKFTILGKQLDHVNTWSYNFLNDLIGNSIPFTIKYQC